MTAVCLLIQAYFIVLLAYVVLSWVPRPPEPIRPFARLVARLVEPLAVPLRRLIPPVQMGAVALDLSILVLFFALILLRQAFC